MESMECMESMESMERMESMGSMESMDSMQSVDSMDSMQSMDSMDSMDTMDSAMRKELMRNAPNHYPLVLNSTDILLLWPIVAYLGMYKTHLGTSRDT